jgi:predicted amidohydrolase
MRANCLAYFMRLVEIALVQYFLKPINTFQDFKSQVVKNLDRTLGADFVVFPELFTVQLLSTLPNHQSFQITDTNRISEFTKEFKDLFSGLAAERGQYLVAGSHLIEDGSRFFNTCFVFNPDGSMFEHRKTHVVVGEQAYSTFEGDKLEVLKTDKATVGIAICYEMQFPECVKVLARKGAEIVFSPSWCGDEHGFWRVRHCVQSRCLENQIYATHCCLVGDLKLLDCAGWGRSSILGPCDSPLPVNGVIAETETNQDTVLRAKIDVDEIYRIREESPCKPFNDRIRRSSFYSSELAKLTTPTAR